MAWIRNTFIGLAGVAVVSAGILVFNNTAREASPEIVETVAADEPAETVEPESLGVFSFEVGDCLIDMFSDEDETVEEAVKVPCSEPHDLEVYYEEAFEDESLEVILAGAEDICDREFESFVGIPWVESALTYTYLFPTAETYEDGDREITCLIETEDGEQLTGSMRGANY